MSVLLSRYLEGKVSNDFLVAHCPLSISDHNEGVLATLQQSRRCHFEWTSTCTEEGKQHVCPLYNYKGRQIFQKEEVHA